MNALWNNLLTHKSVTNLLILLTVAYGAFSLFSIRRESAPEVRVPYAIVTTSLPGASPTDVESLITNKIERAVGDVENIKKMTSSSRESVSVVAIEFEASADIDASLQKVRDAVATVRGDLPDDASEPTVADVNFSDQPIIIASVSSDLAPSEFKAFTDSVRDTLERVQGVSRVTVSGVRAPEVTVVARQTALALHNLSLSEVVQAISLQNAELPVGSLTNNNATLPVALKSALTDMYSVATLPITTRSGETLLLQDIALVSDGVEDVSTISRVSYDGAPAQQAATLSVYKQRGSDITKTVAQVEATLAEIEKAHPGVVTQISYNAGAEIKKDLTKLSRTGIEATVLVVLSLFATLGWREAVVAGLSIPLSILLSFIALKETGNTLNFISLFSLILSIGILVDSAIVVTEAIHVNMRRGLRPLLAARTALREYASPLTGGTLTTIAVFLPLFTISGVTGQFIQSIPFTVIFVLIASLIVALGFTPLLAARWCSPSEKASRVEVAQEVYAEKLREWYRTHITSLLDNRRQKLFFVWGLVGSFVLALLLPIVGLVQTTFFQQSDVNWIYLEIEEVPGTPIEKTDLTTRAVEETLAGIPEISSYAVAVGRGSSFSENPQSGPRFASIDITLTDAEERTRTSTEIVEDIQNRVRTFTSSSVRVYQPNNGPPSGAPVVATFEGDDLGTLKSVAQKAEKILTETPGTRSVQSDLSASSIEYEVGIDRLKASELGLSPLVIAQTLRTATYGTEATTIKKGTDTIRVVVKADLNPTFRTAHDTSRATIDALRELSVPTQNGSAPLGSVLSVRLASADDTIRHENQKRIVSVSAYLAPDANAQTVSADFASRMKSLTLPDGVSLRIGGETEDVDQSFRDMFRALLFGSALIFFILILLFRLYRVAFIVLSVVPLSLIGVIVGLLITGQPISFPSMLGFIALSGVVVNHAIILVDVFNRLRAEHPDMSLRRIVIEGGALRLRPILLTKITSIIGLVPLLFAGGIWQPIAVAMIFGLSFTGVITLIFIPVIYLKWCAKTHMGVEKEMV